MRIRDCRLGVAAIALICVGVNVVRGAPQAELDEPKATWEAHSENIEVHSLVWVGDGARLIAGGGKGQIRLWRLSDQSLLQSYEGSPHFEVKGLAVSHDGKILAHYDSVAEAILRWDVDTGKRLAAFAPVKYRGPRASLAFSLDDKELFIGGGPGKKCTEANPTGTFLNPKDVNEYGLPRGPYGGNDLSLSRDQSVLMEYGGICRIWDWKAGKIRFEFKFSGLGPGNGALSPDGTRVVYYDEQMRLTTVDITGAKPRQLAQLKRQPVSRGIAFSPTGNVVLTTDNDYVVKIWEVEKLRLLRKIRAYRLMVGGEFPLAVSPDGKTLATGGDTIRLWDISDLTREKSPSDTPLEKPKSNDKSNPPVKPK